MIDYILDLIKSNPMVGGGIAVVFSGLISYWLRAIPQKIYYVAKKELMTEMTIMSSDTAYEHFMSWISKRVSKNMNKSIRYYKVYSQRRDSRFFHGLALGYGRHVIRYNKTILFINMSLDERKVMEGNTSSDIISIRMIGRNKETFMNLLEEITPEELNIPKVQAYMLTSGSYCKWFTDIRYRPATSVIINKEVKDKIFNRIREFKSPEKEKWYLDHGISYKLGIMLTGEPGTGKSSLIHAIASEIDYDIFYIPIEQLKTAIGVFKGEKDMMYVIEDIDTSKVVKNRDADDNSINIMTGAPTLLSDVLSALDGIGAHGSIIVMTTNHPEQIDPAVLRPGRCDMIEYIGYFGREEVAEFLLRFFPENKDVKVPNNIKPDITGAYLQECVLRGMTIEEILEVIELKEPIKLKLSSAYGTFASK
jgi:chaperone BCS1